MTPLGVMGRQTERVVYDVALLCAVEGGCDIMSTAGVTLSEWEELVRGWQIEHKLLLLHYDIQ